MLHNLMGKRRLHQVTDNIIVTEQVPERKPGRRSWRLRLWLSVVLSLLCVSATAVNSRAQQTIVARVYQSDRSDEDWSFLRDSSKRNDFWDRLKYISLGQENRYLTLSGEIRFRPEGFRIRSVDGTSSASDTYLLQRYLVGADLHLSRRFRVFGEIQSGIQTGKFRSPRPTDQNSMDLHQAFFEWRQHYNARVFGFKAGRQEVEIGSSRLISASPGLNVKRSFDGVAAYYRSASWRLGAVGAKLVSLSTGVFDDMPDHEQTFWGIAASRKSFLFKKGEFAFYYLGLDRSRIEYAQGIGRDQRHTAGVKWTGSGGRTDLNYDIVFQWGSFNNAPVRAWAFSTETGYRFMNARWKPRISLRADFASGDRDPKDPRLQTFNPLFPGNSYAGAVGLLGPSNLTDLTPAIAFLAPRRLVFGLESPSYWRTSFDDGIYNTSQKLLFPPGAGTGKYVGTNPGFIAVWQATTHMQFQGVVSRFLAGSFLEKTFVANGFGFYSATALYRF